jgi:hypothetical protein
VRGKEKRSKLWGTCIRTNATAKLGQKPTAIDKCNISMIAAVTLQPYFKQSPNCRELPGECYMGSPGIPNF